MINSPQTVDIPCTDVASFVFSTGTPSSRETPQYFDATSPSKCFSLAQAEIYVKQLARGLERLGLGPDDKVLLYSQNRLFFPVLLWGVLAARCVFTAASPSASVSELEYQLKNSDAKLLLVGPSGIDVALQAASRTGLARDKVFLFCDPGEDVSQHASHGLAPWTSFWSPVEEVKNWSWKKITTLKEATETTAILNYSSGTTGFPKGVEISHYNAVANSVQLLHKRAMVANTPEGKSRKARLDSSGERWLAPLPMYHAFGQTYYCINAARCGAKVFIMPSFNVSNYLLYLDIYRITFMTAVPTILTMLTKQPHPQRYNLHALETVTSGSAPLSADLGRMVQEMYLRPGVTVKQGWGMTETTCSISGFAPDDEDDGKAVGWLNPNCAAKIVPVDDREFNDSSLAGVTVGEIWVTGPNIMKGYYKNPKGTAETIVEEDGYRWLRTGDIGYFDRRGCIMIIDRLKELIKVKGLQVAPAELEQWLLTHPDVADAAVVGAKVNGDEYPRAFVVRKTSRVTEQELFDMVKNKFARHKWLTGGVYFIESIPRTGSGKVMRRHLPVPEKHSAGKL